MLVEGGHHLEVTGLLVRVQRLHQQLQPGVHGGLVAQPALVPGDPHVPAAGRARDGHHLVDRSAARPPCST